MKNRVAITLIAVASVCATSSPIVLAGGEDAGEHEFGELVGPATDSGPSGTVGTMSAACASGHA